MSYVAPVDDILHALKSAAGLEGLIADGIVTTDMDTVEAVITGTCSVTAPAKLDFGQAITSTSAANINGQLDLTVTCSDTMPYSVAVNYGLLGTNAGTRKMTNTTFAGAGAAPTLDYRLYTTNLLATQIADASNPVVNAPFWISNSGTGAAQTVSIFAQIPKTTTTPAAGTYQDTVIATIGW